MEGEKLQKILSAAGICSRRRAEELIASGRVKVNGKTASIGQRADPRSDRIEVDGQEVGGRPPLLYYLLYKPSGYVTTMRDPQGRAVVTELLPTRERLFPVGRLDLDTEGALLFTNDGPLANALMHPSSEVPKTYRAVVRGVPSEEDLDELRRGVPLEDGMTAPASARLVSATGDRSVVELTLHEGRKREVRRMLDHIGHGVIHLVRTRFAFLDLSGLKKGGGRWLSPDEVEALKSLASGGKETGLPKKSKECRRN